MKISLSFRKDDFDRWTATVAAGPDVIEMGAYFSLAVLSSRIVALTKHWSPEFTVSGLGTANYAVFKEEAELSGLKCHPKNNHSNR
jgi:hypothetical protein